jgi:hypothetical protein
LGEPFKLVPNGICGLNIGGWTSVGYHDHQNPFSFNTYDNRAQLQQQWFYAEKVADGSEGLGFGARIDYVYGTDAPDTQAFGIPNNHWDNSWDNGRVPGNNNGGYGHALPQLYGEVAIGDLSVKVGHFFTIVGNEVVQATGNFFYSRQFTFYNAEPFTHTGALTTYKADDNLELYNGYVTGWDSGFRDNGDAYLGGFKYGLNDNWSAVFSTVQGRFGEANAPIARERGGLQSFILTGKLTDKLTYISQTDVLYTQYQNQTTARNTFGNINYLIYQINDCWAFGQRFEWFNISGTNYLIQGTLRNADVYNYTAGVNYRANANLMFRPECRWVWDKEGVGFNEPQHRWSQAALGGDMIFTF